MAIDREIVMLPAEAPPDEVVAWWLAQPRPRLLAVSSHTSYPPRTGGHQRGFQLYRSIAENGFAVLQWSEAVRKEHFAGLRSLGFRISEGYGEVQHFRPLTGLANAFLQRGRLPPLAFSLAPGRFWSHGPLRALGIAADLIIIDHPWLFPRHLPRHLAFKPLVYNAFDVEYDLLAGSLEPGLAALRAPLLAHVRSVECSAVRAAALSFACSRQDCDRAAELCGVDTGKFVVVPNGVQVNRAPPASAAEKAGLRERLGLSDRPTILFLGSAHRPNVEAARALLQLLPGIDTPDYQLLFVGDSAATLPREVPAQVRLIGRVDCVDDYLRASNIAANPMLGGTGTNVKMLDYMSAGLAVVTTPTGARGLDLTNGHDAEIVPLGAFAQTLSRLIRDEPARDCLGQQGRALVERTYDWGTIGREAAAHLRRLSGISDGLDDRAYNER